MDPERQAQSELLRDALHELEQTPKGSPSGPHMTALYNLLEPAIRRGAAAAFQRWGRQNHWSRRQQCLDQVVGDTWVRLFDNGQRHLRAWDPAQLSLNGWAHLIGNRIARNACQARWQWAEQPTEELWLCILGGTTAPDVQFANRDLLDRARKAVLDGLSPDGQRMFSLIWDEGRSNQDVADITGLKKNAIYRWRNRLLNSLRDAGRRLLGENKP